MSACRNTCQGQRSQPRSLAAWTCPLQVPPCKFHIRGTWCPHRPSQAAATGWCLAICQMLFAPAKLVALPILTATRKAARLYTLWKHNMPAATGMIPGKSVSHATEKMRGKTLGFRKSFSAALSTRSFTTNLFFTLVWHLAALQKFFLPHHGSLCRTAEIKRQNSSGFS